MTTNKKLKIIPAIDLIDGKCVRLRQGDYDKKTIYEDSPLTLAQQFADNGIKYLHLVDLDGAKSGTPKHFKTLEQIATKTDLSVDFSGGLRSSANIKSALSAGASQICIGTMAIKDKTTVIKWFDEFEPRRLIIGIDVREKKIATAGWLEDNDATYEDVISTYLEHKLTTLMCTDILKDGMLSSPNFDLYEEIKGKFPALNLIASGGVTSISDIEKLNELAIYGAIVGKALLEKKITFKELRDFLC